MQSQLASPHNSTKSIREQPGRDNRVTIDLPRVQRERFLFRFSIFAGTIWVGVGLFEAFNSQFFLSMSSFALVALLVTASLVERSGRGELGVDLAFWGSIIVVGLSWVFSSSAADVSKDTNAMLIASATVAAVILIGVYAVRPYQINVMFAVAVTANLFWIVHDHFYTVSWIHFLVGFSVILVVSYVAARFELRLSRQVDDSYKAIQTLNHELERTHFTEGRSHAALADSVAKFSHDVRSPLTVSLNVITALLETNPSDQQKKFIEMLRTSQESILRLVEFGLEGYQSTIGFFDEIRTIDVGRFLAQIADLHQASASSSGPRIEVRVPESSPAVDVPLTGLTRVMDNLVQNALKYTPTGHILLSAELEQTHSVGERFDLKIGVHDSGKGMSAERLEEVRNGTNGPDPSVATSRGIGLASCRSVLAAHQGTLRIDSRDGGGTDVIITIPVRRHTR